MEAGFLDVLLALYKTLAFFALTLIAGCAAFLPVMLCAAFDNPLWIFLYLFSPLILAACYELAKLL